MTSASAWVSTSTPTSTLSIGVQNEYLGESLALSGDGTTALSGAPSIYNGTTSGAAFVFHVAADSDWASTPTSTPVSMLTNNVTSADDFATSLAFSSDGTTALIGADDLNTDIGAAYVFSVAGESDWSSNATPSPTATLTIATGAIDDQFGAALALSPDGTTALITSHGTGLLSDEGENLESNEVTSESTWTTSSSTTANMTVAGNPNIDALGYSVALSADGMVAVVGYAETYEATTEFDADTIYVFHASSEGHVVDPA